MKYLFYTIGICSCLLLNSKAFAQNMHTLAFESIEEMHNFFRYSPGKKIISGHRGTIEDGLPENSIPAFEAVLKQTQAIFEIDPRYTKDSVAILLHDATLDRCTNGSGNVADYSWSELKKLKLRDHKGNVTEYGINTLAEVIQWAKGKTILNLDKKDLPLEETASIIKKHNAYSWVWVTVHNVEQAKFYLKQNKDQFMSVHLKDWDALMKYDQSGLPYDRMIVYIGPEIKESNKSLYRFLNKKGVMCMISSASTYDKLVTRKERASKYSAIFADGASILETDLPIEASESMN